MSDGQVSQEATDQNNAVVLTYVHDGEEKTIDLSDPAQREKAQKQLSKGAGYEKSQDELANLKRRQKDFDTMVEAAKTDEESWLALKGMIEGFTGRTFASPEKLEEHFEGNSDKPDKNVVALQKQIEQLQTKMVQTEIAGELKALEIEFKDEGFDRDAVVKEAQRTGVTDFRLIWNAMSKDAAVERARQELQGKNKKNKEKRLAAATERGSGSVGDKLPNKKFANYREVSEDLGAQIESGKLSLFDDD